MDVRLLGSVEIVVDDRHVALTGAGEAAVLALLALQASRVVTVDHLVDALWGERLPANPANALQLRVSKLRKALGAAGVDAGVVVTRPPGYLLDLAPSAVDALAVSDEIARARQAAQAGDATAAVRAYRQALGTWRGTPLAEFGDAPWAVGEARRLEELRLAATEECLTLELDQGRHVEVLDELEPLIRENPLRERLHALAMLALYRSGRQADALAAFQTARAVLDEELGLDPSPELRALEAAILQQDPTLAAPGRAYEGPTSRLPERVATMVGRDEDVAELVAHLAEDRLVTVTGPGGTGKTTLAIEAARHVEESFEDGAVFVGLAGVMAAEDVPATIASSFGLPPVEPLAGESVDRRLARQLGHRRALVVLDNCEHVVDAAASTVESLLTGCPHIVVLATSREALAVHGEVQYALPPLPGPDPASPADELRDAAAVRLFIDRARAASRTFDPSDDDLATIAGICLQLDGMPLAIELAAARVRSLPLPQLAERLDDRFRLLTTGPRTADARHRTLHDTVDWSYRLLDEPEQVLFRRLGALRGSWTLADAETVCAAPPLDPADVFDVLTRLVDRSLVAPVAGTDRFRMLETIRQFAEQQLHAAGEHDDVMARHVDGLIELAEQADPQLRGHDQVAWLRRLEERHDDLRAALAFCRSHPDTHGQDGLRLAAGLGWFWYVGDHDEGRRHLQGMLAEVPGASPEARGRALQAVALVERPSACVVHPSQPCATAAQASVELLDRAGDRQGAARSRVLLAVEGIRGGPAEEAMAQLDAAAERFDPDSWDAALAAFVRMEILVRHGQTDAGIAEGDRAAALFHQLGDRWGVSAVKAHQGFNLRAVGRVEEALDIYEDGLEVAREVGLHNTVQLVSGEVAMLRVARGEVAAAVAALDEGEAVARRYGYRGGVGFAHVGRGFLARRDGDLAEADRHFAAAVEILEEVGSLPYLAWAASGWGHVRELLGDLPGARRRHDRVLEIARDLQDPWLTALALEGLAGVVASEDPRQAAHLLGTADRLRRTHARPPSPLEALELERIIQTAHASLGEGAFDAAFRDGATRDTVGDDVTARLTTTT